MYEVGSEGVQWSGQLGMVLGGTLHIAARFEKCHKQEFRIFTYSTSQVQVNGK